MSRLDNGPGAVSGTEPVGKALGIGTIVGGVVALAAMLGLELDPGQVLAVVLGIFAVVNVVAGIKARRSVTPNGRVRARS